MAEYTDSYPVQRPDNVSQSLLSSSFPYFPSSHGATPWSYSRNLAPNVTTTTITPQMDPQSRELWNTAGTTIGMGPPNLPPPQQSAFAEYWRQLNSEENSNTHHARRHSSSTASAFSNGSNSSGRIGRPPSSVASNSYPLSTSSIPASISHQGATRYLVPQLQLNTPGLHNGHGVPMFLSSHHMSFSPSAGTLVANGNSNAPWNDEPSPIEQRAVVLAQPRPSVGASLESDSAVPQAAFWHMMPRSNTEPRWNPSLASSTWPPQMVLGSIPHGQHLPQPRVTSTLPPPAAPPNASLPTSEVSPVVRADPSYTHSSTSRLAPESTSPVRSTNLPVDRNRPAIGVRRRSSLSAQVNGGNLVKRKPLPKIYGCDGCGKKFDRPSTLKVHEAIHTGAKDHLCEYCVRAFTVQSNMKRHMRVCKHKPLSPPMSLSYFVCATPSYAPPPAALTFTGPFQAAMDHIDRSGSLPLGRTSGEGLSSSSIHPSISTPSRPPPMIQTASGNVPMVPFEYAHPHFHNGSPPTVKGYKAPMIIAAMFKCDIPLPPVLPHPQYAGLYPIHPGGTPNQTIPWPSGPSGEYGDAREVSSLASSSTVSLPATVHSFDSSTVVNSDADVKSFILDTPDGTLRREEGYAEDDRRRFETCLLTQEIFPLADIRYEERNSYYPRSRYCYHPADYDSIEFLPGPGVVDLPEEGSEFPARD